MHIMNILCGRQQVTRAIRHYTSEWMQFVSLIERMNVVSLTIFKTSTSPSAHEIDDSDKVCFDSAEWVSLLPLLPALTLYTKAKPPSPSCSTIRTRCLPMGTTWLSVPC